MLGLASYSKPVSFQLTLRPVAWLVCHHRPPGSTCRVSPPPGDTTARLISRRGQPAVTSLSPIPPELTTPSAYDTITMAEKAVADPVVMPEALTQDLSLNGSVWHIIYIHI